MKTIPNSLRIIIAIALAIQSSQAGTIGWNGYGMSGGSGGTSWNAATNWGGNVLPGVGDTANLAGFTNNTPSFIITLDAPQSVGTLSIPAYANIPAVTIGSAGDITAGNTIALANVFRDQNNGNSQTIAASVVLLTNCIWDIRNGYNGNVIVSGSISGEGRGLIKAGNNTLTLSGTNTYTGDTVVQNGTLILQSTNLSTGGTITSGGTLTLDFTTSKSPLTNIVNSASTLKMGGGALTLSGKNLANVKNSQTFNGLILNPGAAAISIANGIASGSMILSLGAITHNAGGVVSFSQPTVNATIGATNGYATTTANDASGILGGFATISNTDWATNNGVNIVSYTGYTTPAGNSPTIASSATSNVRLSNASTGIVSLAAGLTDINTLLVNDTAAARTNLIGSGNTLRFGAVGGLLLTSSAKGLTIDTAGNTGTITAGGADNMPGELIINNAATITNYATIADNGTSTVAFTKAGSGTLVLNTACACSGGTFMDGGSLFLPGGVNPLSTTGLLAMVGGTLNMNGAVQTNTTGVTFTGGTLTNGTLVNLGSDYNAQNGTVAANLGGSRGLVKTTPGIFYLGGSPTYTGVTTVLEGTISRPKGCGSLKGDLVVGSPNGMAAAQWTTDSSGSGVPEGKNATVYANGSFYLGDYPALNNLTVIGGSVSVNWPNINGTIEMTGGTIGGGGNIDGNHAQLTSHACNQTALITGATFALNIWYDSTITVEDGTVPIDLKIASALVKSDSYALTKNGAGVLQLTSTGNSLNEKNLNLNAGTLLADNASGAACGKSPVVVAGGATLGGRGFLGGVANYSNANVSLSGLATNLATLAPGTLNATSGSHVLGTLTVGSVTQTNRVTFGSYSRLLVQLGAVPGSNDCLVVNGKITLGSGTTTNYLDIGTTAGLPKSGDYTIATFNVLTGRYFSVRSAPGATLPNRYTVNYLGTPTGSGNELANGSIVVTIPGGGTTVFVR